VGSAKFIDWVHTKYSPPPPAHTHSYTLSCP
jgi:hypothetical protein